MLRAFVKRTAAALPFVYDIAKRGEIVAQYLSRKPHEADYRYFALHASETGLFLDVGANTGQSALSFAATRPKWSIVSVEANPTCLTYLELTQRLLGEKHRILIGAASSQRGSMRLFVPRSGRFYYTQEASTVADVLREEVARRRIGTDFEVEQFEVPSIVLDDLGLTPDVIKLDVQGAELEALRGLVQTIERARPLFMIENSPLMTEVESFLLRYGYVRRNFDGRELSSADSDPLNVFFVATEAHTAARPVLDGNR